MTKDCSIKELCYDAQTEDYFIDKLNFLVAYKQCDCSINNKQVTAYVEQSSHCTNYSNRVISYLQVMS